MAGADSQASSEENACKAAVQAVETGGTSGLAKETTGMKEAGEGGVAVVIFLRYYIP